jgi:hypothetical protein
VLRAARWARLRAWGSRCGQHFATSGAGWALGCCLSCLVRAVRRDRLCGSSLRGCALAEHQPLQQSGFDARDHPLSVRGSEHGGERPPATRRNLAQENVNGRPSQVRARRHGGRRDLRVTPQVSREIRRTVSSVPATQHIKRVAALRAVARDYFKEMLNGVEPSVVLPVRTLVRSEIICPPPAAVMPVPLPVMTQSE